MRAGVIGFLSTLALVCYRSAHRLQLAVGRDAVDWTDVAALRSVAGEHASDVALFYCTLYILKQTLSLPGSAVLNVTGGALFGAVPGFFAMTMLTTLGSSCCFLLSHLLFAPLFRRFFAAKIAAIRQSVKENRDDLLWWLLSARLTPASPNWLLNMVSPLVGVPLLLHAVSVAVGLAPYHYLCAAVGASIADAATADSDWSLFDARSIALLFSAAVAALIPIAFKRYRKQQTSKASTSNGNNGTERKNASTRVQSDVDVAAIGSERRKSPRARKPQVLKYT